MWPWLRYKYVIQKKKKNQEYEINIPSRWILGNYLKDKV